MALVEMDDGENKSWWESGYDTLKETPVVGGVLSAFDNINENPEFRTDPRWENAAWARMNSVGQRSAPISIAAQMNLRDATETRNRQNALAELLAARARGEAPSLAAMQARQATDNTANMLRAQAAGMRGGNPGARQRALLMGLANANQTGAAAAAQARLAEIQAAQQALGQNLAGMRGADIDTAKTQAGFQQETALANQRAALEQTGLNDQAFLGAMQAGIGANQGFVDSQYRGQENKDRKGSALIGALGGVAASAYGS